MPCWCWCAAWCRLLLDDVITPWCRRRWYKIRLFYAIDYFRAIAFRASATSFRCRWCYFHDADAIDYDADCRADIRHACRHYAADIIFCRFLFYAAWYKMLCAVSSLLRLLFAITSRFRRHADICFMPTLPFRCCRAAITITFISITPLTFAAYAFPPLMPADIAMDAGICHYISLICQTYAAAADITYAIERRF